MRYHPVLQPLPRPDELLGSLSGGMHVVILNGQPDAAAAIQQQFGARDVRVSVIDLLTTPDSMLKSGWQLKQSDDADIQAILSAIAEKEGAIDGFLGLSPAGDGIAGIDFEQSVFLFAKHLSRWYRQSSHPSRKVFLLATQLDGQFGLSGAGDWQPKTGAVNGLVKTLKQEWANVFCRVVDFSGDYSAQEKGVRLLAEWTDVDRRLCEVGYDANGRCTIEFEEIAEEEGEPRC